MRQEWIPGDVILIDLNGYYGYGRVLRDTIGFYDIQSTAILDVNKIVKHNFLFQVWVMKYAITKGVWKVIGNVPLSDDLLVRPRFYNQDDITKRIVLTYDGGDETPATLKDCEGLECAAVWDPHHVEDRLRDHFAGRPNSWYELMKPVDPDKYDS